MASIGVRDKRDNLTITVKLYGPSSNDMKLNMVQLKNLVRALTNKHTNNHDTMSGLCKAIADETLSIYSSSHVVWAECDIETDNGHLYSEAAEFVEE
jgi:hypothetical protein